MHLGKAQLGRAAGVRVLLGGWMAGQVEQVSAPRISRCKPANGLMGKRPGTEAEARVVICGVSAGCSGVWEVLGDKALCQHRLLFAALLSVSLVVLQTSSQKLILLEWMSSFTSPSVTVG